jgi:hypothetical protein
MFHACTPLPKLGMFKILAESSLSSGSKNEGGPELSCSSLSVALFADNERDRRGGRLSRLRISLFRL